MQRTRVFAAVIAALAVTGAPRAQTTGTTRDDARVYGTAGVEADRPLLWGDRETWPTEITRRPLTLARGMFELYVPGNINMTRDQVGEPISLAPSLYFGLTDRWMLGVRHQVGVCLGGTDQGCARVYNDVSVDTVFSIGRAAGLELALGLALNAAPLRPDTTWAGEARVIARAGGGALALTVVPTINFGLNDRDAGRVKWAPGTFNLGTYNIVNTSVAFENKEFLLVPATLQFQVGPAFALALGASLNGPLNPDVGSFGDVYEVPVTAAAVFTPIRWVDVGASFTFFNLLGKDSDEDFRQLAVFAAFRR